MGDIRLRRPALWSAGASEARPRFGSLGLEVPARQSAVAAALCPHLYPKKHVLDIQTRRTSRYRAWLRALGVNQSGVRDRRNPENQANRED